MILYTSGIKQQYNTSTLLDNNVVQPSSFVVSVLPLLYSSHIFMKQNTDSEDKRKRNRSAYQIIAL